VADPGNKLELRLAVQSNAYTPINRAAIQRGAGGEAKAGQYEEIM